MTTHRAVHFSLLMLLVFAAGCASDFSQPGSEQSRAQTLVTQDRARQLAFSYRIQARDLRDLARQIETEAYFSSRQLNANIDSTHHHLVRAKEVLTAAEAAEELAREYQRQIPHGQLQ